MIFLPRTLRMARAVVLAAAAAALAGCGVHQRFGHDPALAYATNHTVAPALAPGQYGGNLTYVYLGDPKTFNALVADDADSGAILSLLYDNLIARNSFTLKFEPRLAYMPKVSKDGLTYTFTLRPGLKWSDGQPLTADDVIFTLNVIFDPKIECPTREVMLIDTPQPNGKSKPIAFQYKELDKQTVQFTLPAPWAPADAVFGGFQIMPKHVMEPIYKAGKFNSAYSVDTPPAQLVSCGPFVMSEYVPGQRLTFKPNPNFWKRGAKSQALPYLSDFRYVITPDLNSMVLNFRGGGSDVLDVPASLYPSIARYAARDNYTVVDKGPDWGFSYLAFNMNPTSTMSRTPWLLHLFQDKRFRQAVSYAINRQRVADTVFRGLAHPLWGPDTPADTIYANPQVQQYPYNPGKASQILAQMGMTKGADGKLRYQGHPVKFNIVTNTENNNRKAMATIIQDSLTKLGMEVTFTPIQFNDLIRHVNAIPYDWQACVMGFTGGPEPNDGATIWRSTGPYHQWWPKQTTPATPWEARIDADFNAGAHAQTLAERKKYYYDYQAILGEQQPLIFLVYQNQYTAMRNHYGNLQPSAFNGLSGALWNLEDIYDTHAHGAAPTP